MTSRESHKNSQDHLSYSRTRPYMLMSHLSIQLDIEIIFKIHSINETTTFLNIYETTKHSYENKK